MSGQLPSAWRKVECMLIAERPVELGAQRVEDDVDLVDDGDGAPPPRSPLPPPPRHPVARQSKLKFDRTPSQRCIWDSG